LAARSEKGPASQPASQQLAINNKRVRPTHNTHTMPNMWKTAATAAGERKLCAETAPPAPSFSFLLFDFYGEHKKIK
jgi:hypothetical protein